MICCFVTLLISIIHPIPLNIYVMEMVGPGVTGGFPGRALTSGILRTLRGSPWAWCRACDVLKDGVPDTLGSLEDEEKMT